MAEMLDEAAEGDEIDEEESDEEEMEEDDEEVSLPWSNFLAPCCAHA